MTSTDLFTSDFSNADAQLALTAARAAIARWTGGVRPSADLPAGQARVSPQERWADQAQHNLAQWIAHGGFSQVEGASQPLPSLMRPRLYMPMALESSGDTAFAE